MNNSVMEDNQIADLCSIQSKALEYEPPSFDITGLNIAGVGVSAGITPSSAD